MALFTATSSEYEVTIQHIAYCQSFESYILFFTDLKIENALKTGVMEANNSVKSMETRLFRIHGIEHHFLRPICDT